MGEDPGVLRQALRRVPETLLAVSSSKSFSLDRERTGALFAISAGNGAQLAATNLAGSRAPYSMPPEIAE